MTDTPPPLVRGDAAPAAPRRASRTLVWGLAAVTVVAIAIRVVAIRNTWGFGQDQYTYLETARIFRDGEWRDVWTFRFLHPLYPMLIALVDTVVRDMDLAARGISLVATVACGTGLGWWWGRRRGAAEGIAIAAAFALNPGPILVGSEALTEGLTLPVAAWTFVLCARVRGRVPTMREAAVVGLMFAVLGLIKTTCWLMVPGALVAALWPALRRSGLVQRIAPLLLATLMFTVVFLPLAAAPHFATRVLTGQWVDFVSRESNVTDAQVLGTAIPTAVATDTGEVIPEKFEYGEHTKLRKLAANVGALFTTRGGRHFQPWYLFVPLAAVGVWSILRDRSSSGGGAARDWWIVAAWAIGLEWFARCNYVLVDRYLVPGTLATLVPAAVGAVVLVRSGAAWARGIASLRVPAWVVGAAFAAPGLVVAAWWSWSFYRQSVEPGARPNIYQVLGKRSALLGDARPRVLASLDAQVCWFARARRIRLPKGGPEAIVRYLDTMGCDGLVVGPGELQQNPGLREALDVPEGGTWRGLRVVAAVPGAVILRK